MVILKYISQEVKRYFRQSTKNAKKRKTNAMAIRLGYFEK